MKTETCKYLTEEVLKRCWHRKKTPSIVNQCGKCLAIGDNLTFTTANEIKLLTDKMKENKDSLDTTKAAYFEVYLAENFGSSRHIWREWVELEPQEQAQLIKEFYESL